VSKFSSVTGGFIEELRSIVGSEGVSTAKSVRLHHGHDESYHRYSVICLFLRYLWYASDAFSLDFVAIASLDGGYRFGIKRFKVRA